jgi:hypothetical protein
MTGRLGGDVLALLAIAALIAANVSQAKQLAQQRRVATSLREEVEIHRLSDRLVSRRLADGELSNLDGDEVMIKDGLGGRAVWVVAPRECPGCLNQLGSMRHARGDHVIVLSEVSLPEARQLARQAEISGTVLVDSLGILNSGLALTAPSVHLLLAGDLQVVLAEARAAHTPCQWDFLEQIRSASVALRDVLPDGGAGQGIFARTSPAAVQDTTSEAG